MNDNTFFQFPTWLLFDEDYKELSYLAKLMYMLMADRMGLSVANGWTDENGEVFQYFTVEQFATALNATKPTIIKAKKELLDIGLLVEVRKGFNTPNRLYIKTNQELKAEKAKKEGEEPAETLEKSTEVKNFYLRSKKSLPLRSKTFTSEVKNLYLRSKKSLPQKLKSFTSEVKNFNPIYTEYNQINNNQINNNQINNNQINNNQTDDCLDNIININNINSPTEQENNIIKPSAVVTEKIKLERPKRLNEAIKFIDWLDGFHVQKILEYMELDGMSEATIVRAIDICRDSNKKSFRYLDGILKSWRRKGIKTVEDVEKEERERRQKNMYLSSVSIPKKQEEPKNRGGGITAEDWKNAKFGGMYSKY